jgi:hypothetical protein
LNGRTAVSLVSTAAAGVDAMPIAVAAIAATPRRRTDVDENAKTIIAAITMIPLRTVTRRVSLSSGFMLSS